MHCNRKKEAVESISPATSTLVLAPSVAGWTELCMQSVVVREWTDLVDSTGVLVGFRSKDKSANKDWSSRVQ